MTRRLLGCLLTLVAAIVLARSARAFEGDAILKDFRFASGEALPELRVHYRTFGKLARDRAGHTTNAVLILHGTTGSSAQFENANFAGELFGPGQPLDTAHTYVILPDGIGHGRSSKPSDGLRARFPRYRYADMVLAQHRLVTEALRVDHLRLVVGTSMGGMHTWMWGERYPDMMDALLPLASLPVQIAGRNRVWRRMVIDGIRNDPEWRGGDYTTQPQSLRLAAQMLWLMSSNPLLRQQAAPSRAAADSTIDAFAAAFVKRADANDVLYALEASADYDPAPDLAKIRAPLLAINFADDLINPPELGILEREIASVPKGRAITIPMSPKTAGHGTHTLAAVWKQELVRLLGESAPRDGR